MYINPATQCTSISSPFNQDNNCFLIHMYKIYQIGLYVKYYNQFALNPTPSATKHRQGRFGIRHIFRSLLCLQVLPDLLPGFVSELG